MKKKKRILFIKKTLLKVKTSVAEPAPPRAAILLAAMELHGARADFSVGRSEPRAVAGAAILRRLRLHLLGKQKIN